MAKRKEDDFPAFADQKRARPGPSTRPESESDLDSDDEMECPSPQDSSAESSSESESGDFGIIESIQVENFMGYARLGPVKFGANVNFVVGHSGKNALLTALIVGLGGKSLGSSLKEFVKDGEDSATISIKLRNRGQDAFKSEVYGDSITVHQYISVDGSASYELKDQVGNLVSSKKEELIAILDHFKIQVDNPMSVLPQKMSRQLLRITNESDRYKLFMEATELEQMREGYAKILARKARSQQEIQQGEEQLEELRRQGVEIEEHFQTMVALDQKLKNLKHEKTWALVNETERTISNMISDINVEDQHTVILNHDLEVSKVTYNETLQRYIAIHENVVKLNEEAAELEPKCLEAKEIAKRTDRAYRQATAFYNYSQSELTKLDKVSEQLHDKIVDLRKSLELAELEKQKKISTLREKIHNFKDQEDSLVQEIKYLHQSIEKDDEEHSRIREEEAFVQEMLNEEQEQLNHLKDYKTDPLKRFGPQIPPLVEAIEDAFKQGYFTHKPLGPLGACIRLRYPEYALAIESCLKGLLLDFFCDNHKDEQVLQELLKRFYPTTCSDRPQVIVSSFQCELYDLTDRAACHPEYPTVLSALEIDHAVVANTLVDLRSIESVLLVRSGSFASMHAQGRPKNCTKILTSCGDQVFEGRYYSCEDLRPIYLGDMEGEINHLEKQVESKMTKLSEFQEQVNSLQNDIKKNRETIDSHYRHLREIKVKVINISSEIKDLEDEEENQSIDLSVLEDEAEEIKEEIKEVEEKMKNRKETMENLRQPKIDAEQRHEEFKLKCSQVSELVESLMEERNQTGLEVSAQHQSVLHYQNRLKHHVDSLQVIKEELAMKERELEREMAQANYLCPERIAVTRASDVLDREIDLLTQRIQSENYTHRRREDITRQYQQAKEKYLDINGRVNNLKSLIETLDEILVQRYDTYQKSRRNLSLQCKLFFDSLMSHWSFCGEMRFNHKNETLSITVQPGEADGSDMGGLSANRHSFSNFLFILTLWSVTESPFRCLDTVDIYMDRKSRKIAMEMIVWIAAHSYQNHQVILLSPQYLSSFPSSPLVEVLEMPDLESEEKTLPFESVNPKEN
ncbi:structural maintenance of chromosomes protein 6-like [Trichosurus vulpecula]|uniref:structural maintenance of chromosomes protein 6-like n=1 Tax=Trichosurus vulpecula TaxID=9337 RepID=UPI00186AD44A|nr:structural maintenance of chromosomes protein 6-like [Trichosurus vulpecula]